MALLRARGALLLLLAAPALAVITSQGPWGPGGRGGPGALEGEEQEVRQFTGWLQGGEQDYVMTLAQVLLLIYYTTW